MFSENEVLLAGSGGTFLHGLDPSRTSQGALLKVFLVVQSGGD